MTKHSYFEQAASWASDQQENERRSRKTAWLVAGAAVGTAAFEAVAIAMMMPLKTVQPVTLLVDRQTGFTEVVDPNAPRRISADDALTQALLAQYVSAREGFDRATLKADYRRVGLWSAGSARQNYLSLMQPANPASPLNRYSPTTIVSVRVKSVSRLAPNVALVRFGLTYDDQNGRVSPESAHIATIRYRFLDAAMAFEDRLINPLGFQVLSYRRELEAPEPAPGPNPAQPVVTVPAPAAGVAQ